MTLTELRYIIAVAREKHFGRAAKTCYVSQSTLSLGIKKLEEEMGAALFERGQKDILVTPFGMEIVKRAERIVAEIEAIKAIGKRYKGACDEPVRVGAIYTVGPYLFPSLLPASYDNDTKSRLLIEENYTDVLLDRLKHGRVDIAIVSLPIHEPGVEVIPIYDEPLVALVPAAHPLALCETIDANVLARETILLLAKNHCLRDQVLSLFPSGALDSDSGEVLSHIIEGGSLETIRYMVASGVGLAIVPATAACVDKFSQRLVRVRRFSGTQPIRTVALAYRKTFDRIDIVRTLLSAVSECNLSCVTMRHSKSMGENARSNGELVFAAVQ